MTNRRNGFLEQDEDHKAIESKKILAGIEQFVTKSAFLLKFKELPCDIGYLMPIASKKSAQH